jgi:hypothetical protein
MAGYLSRSSGLTLAGSANQPGVFVRWSIVIGLIVVVGLSVAAWFFSPKGETQT